MNHEVHTAVYLVLDIFFFRLPGLPFLFQNADVILEVETV